MGSLLTLGEVLSAWWPLAASWLLMGFEQPAASAVMARLEDPVHSLAAFGGIVFPIAFLIESPIIMLLSASTALSRDRASYRLILGLTHRAGLVLTVLHAALVFSPLYGVVALDVLGMPPEVAEPGRLGLAVMLPWSWAIGYRRFQQGLLIRAGRSRLVGAGTAVRLAANGAALAAGWLLLRDLPAIVTGTLAVSAGVVAEAAFAGAMARSSVRALPAPDPGVPPLDLRAFARFYVPLAMTPLIALLTHPIAAAAIARMPQPVESLAALPVMMGMLFVLRSPGVALTEVSVSLLDRAGAPATLRRFTRRVAWATVGLLAAVAATPLSDLWLEDVTGLEPALVGLVALGLWLGLPTPWLAAWQNLYQGTLVHAGRTRGVTESTVAALAATGLVLAAGVATGAGGLPGLWIAVAASGAGTACQVAWLRYRAGPVDRHRPNG